jgi:hypothetical protein
MASNSKRIVFDEYVNGESALKGHQLLNQYPSLQQLRTEAFYASLKQLIDEDSYALAVAAPLSQLIQLYPEVYEYGPNVHKVEAVLIKLRDIVQNSTDDEQMNFLQLFDAAYTELTVDSALIDYVNGIMLQNFRISMENRYAGDRSYTQAVRNQILPENVMLGGQKGQDHRERLFLLDSGLAMIWAYILNEDILANIPDMAPYLAKHNQFMLDWDLNPS